MTSPSLEPPRLAGAPRWFWPVVAVALLGTGAAVSWAAIYAATRPHWVPFPGAGREAVLDARSGLACGVERCVPIVRPGNVARAHPSGDVPGDTPARDLTRAP